MSNPSLLERVEAAAGADREIDALIAEAFGGFTAVYRSFDESGAVADVMVEHDEDDFDDCPRYTSSLDAALSLVERALPGWRWIVDSDFDRGPPYAAQVKKRGNTWAEAPRCFGASPALALLAALLRATEEKPHAS